MQYQENHQESDDEGQTVPGDGWLKGFKKLHGVSFQRATNVCKKEPDDSKVSSKYSNGCFTIGCLGQWYAASVANMDQTPMPFTFDDGKQTNRRSLYGCVEANLVWKNTNVSYTLKHSQTVSESFMIFKGKI